MRRRLGDAMRQSGKALEIRKDGDRLNLLDQEAAPRPAQKVVAGPLDADRFHSTIAASLPGARRSVVTPNGSRIAGPTVLRRLTFPTLCPT